MATRDLELSQLQRRYAGFRVDDDGRSLLVTMTSTDPDLPVPVSSFRVRCTLPPDYPLAGPAVLAIVPGAFASSAAALPDSVVVAVNEALARRLGAIPWPAGQPMLRDALRWVESVGFGEALREVLAAQARPQMRPQAPPPKQPQPQPAPSRSSPPPRQSAIPALALAFQGQRDWRAAQQAAFEFAVADLFDARGRALDDASAWADVAARVSSAGPSSLPRLPEACVARFLALRCVCDSWLANARPSSLPSLGPAPSAGSDAPVDDAVDLFGRAWLTGATVSAEGKAGGDEVELAGGDEAEADEPEEEEEWSEDECDDGTCMEHGVASEVAAAPLFNIYTGPASAGRTLLLERLTLSGFGALAASAVVVVAQCDGCAASFTTSLGGASLEGGSAEDALFAASELKRWCDQCALLLTLRFRPTLVHDGSPSLGFIEATQCSVVGVLQPSLIAHCLECCTAAEIEKALLKVLALAALSMLRRGVRL